MKETDILLANACQKALRALFHAMRDAEEAGLQTHIYVPEGSAEDARQSAYVQVGRCYRVE